MAGVAVWVSVVRAEPYDECSFEQSAPAAVVDSQLMGRPCSGCVPPVCATRPRPSMAAEQEFPS